MSNGIVGVLPTAPLPSDPAHEATPLLQDGSKADDQFENAERPTGIRFAIVFACILMGDFFVGYDTSCVATLTPVISDEFQSIDDLGWYGIAYLLASASTVLLFGQLYTIFPMKTIFLLSFAIFAAGSFLSAVALSSVVFILGRAVSGLGSAGIFSGGSIIVASVTPLKSRPIYQAIAGGMECLALALGPLIAGAITEASSWRACFAIMVPVAACIIAAVAAFVHNLPEPEHADFNLHQRLQQVDLLGMGFFLPMNICLILALQWGGIILPWHDSRIIALTVLAGVSTIGFGLSQWYKGDKAMFPLVLLRQRSVSLGIVAQFSISACLFVFGFYLPIYFQAVRGVSALDSGMIYLSTAASLGLALLLAGNFTSFIGYYTPSMVLGTLLLSTGAGLMTTFDIDTPTQNLILYQILFGLGAGLAFQQTYTAVQTVLPAKIVPTALVCLNFAQELGGIVTLAISQNLFLRQIISRLTEILPDLDPRKLIDQGTVSLPHSIPLQYREAVYDAYMKSVIDVFYIGLGCACLTAFAIGIEWRSVHEEQGSDEAMGEDNLPE